MKVKLLGQKNMPEESVNIASCFYIQTFCQGSDFTVSWPTIFFNVKLFVLIKI